MFFIHIHRYTCACKYIYVYIHIYWITKTCTYDTYIYTYIVHRYIDKNIYTYILHITYYTYMCHITLDCCVAVTSRLWMPNQLAVGATWFQYFTILNPPNNLSRQIIVNESASGSKLQMQKKGVRCPIKYILVIYHPLLDRHTQYTTK